MAYGKYLARNHRFYITDDADYVGATWTVISGINSWGWSEEGSDVDISDFENSGWTSAFVVSRGATLTMEGQYIIDEATGAKDAGQLKAERAAHRFGTEGQRWIKVEGLNTARSSVIGSIIAKCAVSMAEIGGGMEDAAPFGIEGMVIGQPIGSGIYGIFDQTL